MPNIPRRLVACSALLLACGTSSATTTGDASHPVAASATSTDPPHVFTPRPHPARQHRAPPAPNLASLPRMVDRSRECFGPDPSEIRSSPAVATPTRKPSKKSKAKKSGSSKSPGYVPYDPATSGGGGAVGGVSSSGSKGSAPAKDAPKKPRPSSPPAEPKRVTDSDVTASAPAAEPEPASAPDATPGRERARDRKKERRNDRKPNDDAAPAAGAPVQLEEEDSSELQLAQADPDDQYEDWGASIYLSNDDTMSLSSAQRVIFAIDNFLPLPAEHIRPHELLNYFSFDTAPVGESDDFSVNAGIAPDPDRAGVYSLALGVRGRPMGVDDRRNGNLAFVIDRSGSMSAEGRMDFLKRGLLRSLDELKQGDLVHIVMFDNQVCTPVENFVVGRDSMDFLQRTIERIEPRGATDLHAGLTEGYAITDRAHQPSYTNRVVMITDAITNSGVTDQELIATVSKFYDRRQIRLSGVGVGSEFNDGLLDTLTERGRGAYVFLGSPAEVDAVFGARFVSLVETTAVDVHFRLHLPPSLRMNTFYGEESSTVKEDVQAIHYFANTSQLFLSDLMARGGELRGQDEVMLTIEYDEPESGEQRVEEYAFNLGEATELARNVAKGRLIMHFVDGLAWMASRPAPSRSSGREGQWEDERAWEGCEVGRSGLDRMSQTVADDPEVRRVIGLWEKYCSRYSRPRQPVRRPPAEDTWPGAAE